MVVHYQYSCHQKLLLEMGPISYSRRNRSVSKSRQRRHNTWNIRGFVIGSIGVWKKADRVVENSYIAF